MIRLRFNAVRLRSVRRDSTAVETVQSKSNCVCNCLLELLVKSLILGRRLYRQLTTWNFIKRKLAKIHGILVMGFMSRCSAPNETPKASRWIARVSQVGCGQVFRRSSTPHNTRRRAMKPNFLSAQCMFTTIAPGNITDQWQEKFTEFLIILIKL